MRKPLAVLLVAAFVLLPVITPKLVNQYANRTAAFRTKLVLFTLFGLGALALWAGSEAVLPASKADHDLAQRAVVHVHDAAPGDAARVDAQFVAEVQVVVQHRRKQVVAGGNGVEVARKVQVDILHRNYLRISATGSTSFNTKNRAKRWFTQYNSCFLAYPVQSLGQSY